MQKLYKGCENVEPGKNTLEECRAIAPAVMVALKSPAEFEQVVQQFCKGNEEQPPSETTLEEMRKELREAVDLVQGDL